MLKLTLPEQDDFYAEFVSHPACSGWSPCPAAIRATKRTSACAGITESWPVFREHLLKD